MRRVILALPLVGVASCFLMTSFDGLAGHDPSGDVEGGSDAPTGTDAPGDVKDLLPEATVGIRIRNLRAVTASNLTPIPELDPLTTGMTIQTSKFPPLTVEAITDPSVIGSVKFIVDGVTKVENMTPYILTGDDQGAADQPWQPLPGPHTITAISYANGDAGGGVGYGIIVDLNVVF